MHPSSQSAAPCSSPKATSSTLALNLLKVLLRVGVEICPSSPSPPVAAIAFTPLTPSCPEALNPQTYKSPVDVIAAEEDPPALTFTKCNPRASKKEIGRGRYSGGGGGAKETMLSGGAEVRDDDVDIRRRDTACMHGGLGRREEGSAGW